LPRQEDFNLRSQIIRAATSIALNVAEGSTGQTNDEQARFLGLAIRSTLETVACQHLIRRRQYPLTVGLQAFRRAIAPSAKWLREEDAGYVVDGN
jgi:four helix bundle protein